ncbi:hypothetical protein M9194_14935 [Vibrio sp. S4M6]|uniref:hypothetical protein n=1 Tax=Vibrio sinus TaxID=2946865 RepID=UPI002029EB35|nr:hypothetical protein [Vibrio sinus]MCL9782728.1 hypothetical protein [Vibrio sinus]
MTLNKLCISVLALSTCFTTYAAYADDSLSYEYEIINNTSEPITVKVETSDSTANACVMMDSTYIDSTEWKWEWKNGTTTVDAHQTVPIKVSTSSSKVYTKPANLVFSDVSGNVFAVNSTCFAHTVQRYNFLKFVGGFWQKASSNYRQQVAVNTSDPTVSVVKYIISPISG